MVEFLDKLRAKPKEARRRIALSATTGIFAVVFVVWWMTWTSPITSDDSTKDVVSPFGIMAGAAAATRDGLSKLPGQILNQVKYVATSSDPYGQGGMKASDVIYPDQLLPDASSTASSTE